jgi:disulfide bond formation protein DsbB
MMKDLLQSVANAPETVKISPAAAVAGLSLLGVTLEQWVSIVTILYILILVAHKVYTWNDHRRIKRLMDERDEHEDCNGP